MVRRDRFAFFLRPERPAEFASVLVTLASAIGGDLGIDLTEDVGMILQGVDSSCITMVRMRATIGAFKEYSLRAPAHLSVSSADLGEILRGYSGALILYQEVDEPDLLIVEKVDARSKWTLRLRSNEVVAYEIPAAPARAWIGYSEGKRLARSMSELKVALGDDADVAIFSIASRGGWVVRCGGSAGSRRFAQRLVGDDALAPREPISLIVSGRHLLAFLRVASVAKGSAALRVIGFPTGDMFCVFAESEARDFEVEMFIAPREGEGK